MVKKLENRKIYDVKRCLLCGDVFDVKTSNSLYCNNQCKQAAYLIRKKNKNGYQGDLNKNVKLPPGTITSQGSPESAHVFTGMYTELENYLLKHYITEKQLMEERQFLNKLDPLFSSMDWHKSSCQIFSDTHLLEIMKVYPGKYKLYAQKWESPDENPFPI